MDMIQLELAVKDMANRLGVDVSDQSEMDKIRAMIQDAMFLIHDFTGRDEGEDSPSSFWIYAKRLAIISWNKEGVEGELSRSEGGISQTYVAGIPEDIKSALMRYRKGSVIRVNETEKTRPDDSLS